MSQFCVFVIFPFFAQVFNKFRFMGFEPIRKTVVGQDRDDLHETAGVAFELR